MKIIAGKKGKEVILSKKEYSFIQRKIAKKLGKDGPFNINKISVSYNPEVENYMKGKEEKTFDREIDATLGGVECKILFNFSDGVVEEVEIEPSNKDIKLTEDFIEKHEESAREIAEEDIKTDEEGNLIDYGPEYEFDTWGRW